MGAFGNTSFFQRYIHHGEWGSGFLIKCVYGTYAGYISLHVHCMAIGIEYRSSIHGVKIQLRS